MVKPNQYLGYIAERYGVSVEDLAAFSGIKNPDAVPIGQGLIIPHRTDRRTPDTVLIPDSELVYGGTARRSIAFVRFHKR